MTTPFLDELLTELAGLPVDPSTRALLDRVDTALGRVARDAGIDLTTAAEARAACLGALGADFAAHVAGSSPCEALGLTRHLFAVRALLTAPPAERPTP